MAFLKTEASSYFMNCLIASVASDTPILVGGSSALPQLSASLATWQRPQPFGLPLRVERIICRFPTSFVKICPEMEKPASAVLHQPTFRSFIELTTY
jgi:hypothetical protein